eukprot:TRINITY_DN2317_c1_g1_i3.p1 TRINITY_DN2317_c1_g1~~TRINITY_DN2317_c1_g1_i3.p1  ORF type:complete len:885 (+),score=286.66 TRINITY_DN2317_c1_g1_i3:86-2656(+)
MATDRVLLPAHVRPVKYSITLEPDLTTFAAPGSEEVTLQVKDATDEIVVHSKEITIHSVVISQNGNSIVASNISYAEKEERATFKFPQKIQPGDAILTIKFDAIINDKMAGFYRSKYFLDGKEKYLATTQFEATDARRAFPCWDEPAVKAIFEMIIIAPADRVVLSNMDPVDQEKRADGKQVVKFAPSPIMSTYLLAFIVGEFDYVEDHTKEGVRIRVYTPVGKKDLGKFALSVGSKTLSYFTEYFGIPYPLPKLDMVAIADFSAGAMENWGLVTYREIALLCDASSAVSTKQRVAYVVAHELAHQWFGNLVTMEWWSQLWLNEGFATFVGNLATNHLFPEWDVWTLFVNDYQATAFHLDGLKNSHPIEVDVKTSDEISEIFDAISYNKGSCVIRMLEAHLGEGNFKKGLHTYLTRFEYKNAVTEDLWQALAEASGVNVKDFMDSFTKHTGYPVVTVQRDGQKVEVSQHRFLQSGEVVTDDVKWALSLRMASSSGEVSTQTVTDKKTTITVPFKGDDWIKFNYGQSGFFRIRYSEELLEKLLPPLKALTLPPVDRLGVQGDTFALARAGFLPTSKFFEIAEALSNEVEYTVWNALSTNIGTLSAIWAQEPVQPQLKAFVRRLFNLIHIKLGWDAKSGEKPSDTLLRSVVLRKLGAAGHEEVVKEAQARYNKSLTSPESLVADLKPAVYEIVLNNGGQATLDTFIRHYTEATSSEDKTRILSLLAQQPTAELTRKVYEWALNSGHVRDQDFFMIFSATASIPHGPETAWAFLKDNWDAIYTRLSGGGALLTRIIGNVTAGFNRKNAAQEIEEFFKAHPYPPADRTIKQSIETINSRSAWLERSRDDVASYLQTLFKA